MNESRCKYQEIKKGVIMCKHSPFDDVYYKCHFVGDYKKCFFYKEFKRNEVQEKKQ